MATYNIKYTDINRSSIIINQGDVNTTSVDIALFGRINQEYGELLNENMLHLLEHFACPENPTVPGTPDTAIAINNILSNPTVGQIWYNSTQEVPFIWDGSDWEAIGSTADFAANSGKILHGQQLPLPVSATGYQFSYAECVWIVSPSGVSSTSTGPSGNSLGTQGFNYMVCTTDDNGLVNHQYASVQNGNALINGVANYLILGIRNTDPVGNPNPRQHNYSTLAPAAAPYGNYYIPTPTPTVTISPAGGVTPTPTTTPTPTATPSPTVTPTPSVFSSVTPTPTVTPSTSINSGVSAQIFLQPSILMAQTFGNTSNSLTGCTTTSTAQACKKALQVWVANLGGAGNGVFAHNQYTVQWNLNFFYSVYYVYNGVTVWNTAPPNSSTLYPYYTGNFGASSNDSWTGGVTGYRVQIYASTANLGVNGGPGLNTNAYCIANYIPPNIPTPNSVTMNVSITLLAGSYVAIGGLSSTAIYYTPSGSYGTVSGTQIYTVPSSNYVDGYSITYQA